MEIEKAMEVLRKIAKKAKIEDSKTRVAIFEALKALEKQMPKKPKKVVLDSTNQLPTYECMKCGEEIYLWMKYCHGCGQKLDWSEA